jgi:membrane-associated phospholipid phosphatase
MYYLHFLWSSRFGTTIFWLAGFLVVFNILKWLFIKKGKVLVKFLISLVISAGKGIKDNPGIGSFFGRHPALAMFLKKRLDLTKFSGLMSTILVLLVVYAVGSFVGTATDVFVPHYAANVDLSLANLLHDFRNPLLVKVFLWVTLLGNWRIVAVMVPIIAILFWLWNKKNYIVPFLVSVGGSFVTGTVFKFIWHRPRPMDVGVYLEKSWSFPSGHAVLAVSLYGFLIYFFWKYFKKWKNKINALFLGILVIIFIGFSRLYLGVHYLSDVWAGGMVGFFWLVISIGLVESGNTILNDKIDKDSKSALTYQVRRSTIFITIAMLCLLVVGYAGYGLRYKPLFNPAGEEENLKKVDDARVGEIFTDYKLPKFTETLLGNPQEPISFIIIADSDQQLIKSFQRANWFLAENINFKFLAATFKSVVLNKPYPTAPMTPYFWQTYTNDFGFQEPTAANSARYRHHARFWRTNFTTVDDKNIYVGITSLDMGVKWWGITHKIKPDIDSEREYLFDALNNVSAVKSLSKEQFVDPVLGKNFTGDQFFTDGKVYIMYLK